MQVSTSKFRQVLRTQVLRKISWQAISFAADDFESARAQRSRRFFLGAENGRGDALPPRHRAALARGSHTPRCLRRFRSQVTLSLGGVVRRGRVLANYGRSGMLLESSSRSKSNADYAGYIRFADLTESIFAKCYSARHILLRRKFQESVR